VTEHTIMWSQVLDMLTFRAGYNAALVVLGTAALGVAAGVVGVFAFLRGRALISDTLAHATLPGVCGAFVVGVLLDSGGVAESAWAPGRLALLLGGAVVSGVLGVLAVHALTRVGRVGEDAAMAVVLSVFFGAGVVGVSVVQRMGVAGQAGLERFILGQTAALNQRDVWLMAATAAAVTAVTAACFKELRMVCFDRAFAAAQRAGPAGATAVDLLLLVLVVLVTVVGLQAVGLILIVALLITPAVAARLWTDRLAPMVVISAGLGAVSGMVGSAVSGAVERVPAGPAIVLTATLLFLVSLLAAPRRGVLARAVALWRQGLRVRREHLLRAAYERAEEHGAGMGAALDLAAVRARRMSGPTGRGGMLGGLLGALALRSLYRGGLAVPGPGGTVRLTPAGQREAARITRVHRLWEQYLISRARHDPTHADDPADLIEHALDPEIIADLERDVSAGGGRVPPSPHVLPRAQEGGGA
jgi:manganese/zinc/iron transport system permease protein